MYDKTHMFDKIIFKGVYVCKTCGFHLLFFEYKIKQNNFPFKLFKLQPTKKFRQMKLRRRIIYRSPCKPVRMRC